jgi:hypothetical protein
MPYGPPLKRRAMRENQFSRALSGIFDQGNGNRFGIHRSQVLDYDAATVQPGMAMTVKEMGAVIPQSDGPFSVYRGAYPA